MLSLDPRFLSSGGAANGPRSRWTGLLLCLISLVLWSVPLTDDGLKLASAASLPRRALPPPPPSPGLDADMQALLREPAVRDLVQNHPDYQAELTGSTRSFSMIMNDSRRD